MAVGVAGVDVDGTGQRIVLFYSCFFRAMLIEGMKMEMSPSADAAGLVYSQVHSRGSFLYVWRPM